MTTRLENSENTNAQFRWSEWEHDVLSKVDPDGECSAVIVQRQLAVDDDRDEAELVKAHFEHELCRYGHVPIVSCVFIPSKTAAVWLTAATQIKWATNKASAHLRTLGIAELRKSKRGGMPGWRWTGQRITQLPGGEPSMQELGSVAVVLQASMSQVTGNNMPPT